MGSWNSVFWLVYHKMWLLCKLLCNLTAVEHPIFLCCPLSRYHSCHTMKHCHLVSPPETYALTRALITSIYMCCKPCQGYRVWNQGQGQLLLKFLGLPIHDAIRVVQKVWHTLSHELSFNNLYMLESPQWVLGGLHVHSRSFMMHSCSQWTAHWHYTQQL